MSIEAVVDCWAQFLVDDLVKFCQADDKHVGQLLKVIKKIGYWIGSKKQITAFCVQNWTYVVNI